MNTRTSMSTTLLTAAFALTAPSALAEVITFVNNGEFTWVGIDPNVPDANPDSNALDITKPATQPGDITDGAFLWILPTPASSSDVSPGQVGGGFQARVARGELAKAQGELFFPAKVFHSGDTISAIEDFGFQADTYAFSFAGGSTLLIGESAFLGVELILNTGSRFGWIRVAWNGTEYQPLAWAYETEPNTPITIPPLCDEDLTFDGKINSQDLNTLLAAFGADSGPEGAAGDVDGDGDTDSSDLNLLLSKFGTGC